MSSQYVLVNVSLFTEEKVYREYAYVRLWTFVCLSIRRHLRQNSCVLNYI